VAGDIEGRPCLELMRGGELTSAFLKGFDRCDHLAPTLLR
jgi:hypothetical protein